MERRIAVALIVGSIVSTVPAFGAEPGGLIGMSLSELGKDDKAPRPISNWQGKLTELRGKPFLGALGGNKLTGTLERAQTSESFHSRGAKEVQVYASISPAVVLIVTDDGLGSGTIVDGSGSVLTNWHVVRGYREVGVIYKPTRDGDKPTEADLRLAEVVRIDTVADLALLRVREPRTVTPVKLGSLSGLSVGSDVHAIGHPTGEAWTYSKGFVSQIRRQYKWETDIGGFEADVIQTQTPINPGNSGGPLLADDGTLVGVNSFKAKGEALNFAVAVDEIRRFLAQVGDRDPQVRSSAKKGATTGCEPAVLAERRIKEPRNAVLESVDLDCDGKTDLAVVTPDDQSQPIRAFMDSTGDGKIDSEFVDLDRDGNIDVSYFDSDADGLADLRGHHVDGNTRPARLEKLERPLPFG